MSRYTSAPVSLLLCFLDRERRSDSFQLLGTAREQDLSQLGRPISESIIIDNSPASYVFHPNNAVPISSWFNDP